MDIRTRWGIWRVRRVGGTTEKPKSGAIRSYGENSKCSWSLASGWILTMEPPHEMYGVHRSQMSARESWDWYRNADASYDSNVVVTNKMKEMTMPPFEVASTNDRLIFMVAVLKRSPRKREIAEALPRKSLNIRLLCLKAVTKRSDVTKAEADVAESQTEDWQKCQWQMMSPIFDECEKRKMTKSTLPLSPFNTSR